MDERRKEGWMEERMDGKAGRQSTGCVDFKIFCIFAKIVFLTVKLSVLVFIFWLTLSSLRLCM